MKVVAGLGNPGPKYDATRHNVGWWVADRLAYDWKCGAFRQEGPAVVSRCERHGEEIVLLKPTAFMNRSGVALGPYMGLEGFDVSGDLLVVVDDAALDVGRVKFRPGGSPGGHNGLKSVEAAVGTRSFHRLRVGVGRPPPGADLVGWVLSPMSEDDEDRTLELLPRLTEAVDLWVREGMESVMNRFNR